MTDEEITRRAAISLKQLNELQQQYREISAYAYFEIVKKELLNQYKILREVNKKK